jgi:hypothetical protein
MYFGLIRKQSFSKNKSLSISERGHCLQRSILHETIYMKDSIPVSHTASEHHSRGVAMGGP